MFKTMKKISGRILIVQEDRFRVIAADGRGYLLALSHSARIRMADLRRYQQAGTRIQVEYEGSPNLADGIAYKLAPF
jgi:hypothetical protein